MKINNHGWEMKDMIIYSCLLLFFLLIAVLNVHSLYSDISNKSSERNNNYNNYSNKENNSNKKENDVKPNVYINYSIYTNYEKRFAEVAKSYVIENRDTLQTGIATVSLSELVVSGYIEQLNDQKDNGVCSGYANVWDDEEGVYRSQAYIRCTSYVTEGY